MSDKHRQTIADAREREKEAHDLWWVVNDLRQTLDSKQAEYHAIAEQDVGRNEVAHTLAAFLNGAAESLSSAEGILQDIADDLWDDYVKARSAFLQAL